MRAPAERANAPIKHFKPLQHVTLSPTAITAAALASIFRRLVEWVWVASLPVSWG